MFYARGINLIAASLFRTVLYYLCFCVSLGLFSLRMDVFHHHVTVAFTIVAGVEDGRGHSSGQVKKFGFHFPLRKHIISALILMFGFAFIPKYDFLGTRTLSARHGHGIKVYTKRQNGQRYGEWARSAPRLNIFRGDCMPDGIALSPWCGRGGRV